MNITDTMFADVILIDVCYTGGEQSYICFRTWQCLNLTNHITALTNQIVELQLRVKTNLRLFPTRTDIY